MTRLQQTADYNIPDMTGFQAQEIRDKANVQYPIILPDETLCQGTLKGLTAYPVTFFVDSTGKVVGNSYLGARDLDEFLAIALQELTALSDKQQP